MNMSELGRLCGLSKAAVSLALNNHPRIPKKTRDRVRAVADKVGFIVDPKFSQFMSAIRRRNAAFLSTPIAILSLWPRKTEWTQRAGLARFHLGLVERATQLGFRTEDFWLGDPAMRPQRMERILKARGIEAAIVLSYPSAPAKLSIDLSNFACSVIGRALRSPRLCAVDHDHHQGLFLALESVRARGFARPGLVITEDLKERTMHCWVAAYLFDSNLQPPSRRLPFWIINRKAKRSEFLGWFRKHRPDVILGHDLILPFLSDCGITIPETVAFATLSWTSTAPQFAGVDTRREFIAGRAVEIVLEQLRQNRHGISHDPETLLVEGVWRDGPSLTKGGRSQVAVNSLATHRSSLEGTVQ
jgi:LacI family transcriptional regulator